MTLKYLINSSNNLNNLARMLNGTDFQGQDEDPFKNFFKKYVLIAGNNRTDDEQTIYSDLGFNGIPSTKTINKESQANWENNVASSLNHIYKTLKDTSLPNPQNLNNFSQIFEKLPSKKNQIKFLKDLLEPLRLDDNDENNFIFNKNGFKDHVVDTLQRYSNAIIMSKDTIEKANNAYPHDVDGVYDDNREKRDFYKAFNYSLERATGEVGSGTFGQKILSYVLPVALLILTVIFSVSTFTSNVSLILF
jgi:hypothetical protein